MAFLENQMAASYATGRFRRGLVLANAPKKTSGFVGRRVEAKSIGRWHRAKIEDVKGDQFKVHYIHYDRKWGEWVPAARIRKK
jgi:hypothetical protein